MKLVVGLGNPGSSYANTRHNCGFIVLDKFAKKNDVEFKLNAKLKGEVAQITLNGEKAILLKPMTYMNLSGESVILVKNGISIVSTSISLLTGYLIFSFILVTRYFP